jgi:GT2 family glycosyltransferase
MKQRHKVIAVIVNYNKPFDTLRCIKAILKNSQKPSAIIVVDNASTDNSVSILQNSHQIELIVNQQNKGGSGGFNTGIEAALRYKPDYIWLLDDDAYPDIHYLHFALATFDRYPNTGVVGAQILDIDNHHIIVELGANICWDHIGFIPIGRGEKRVNQDYIWQVDYAPACCLLISRQVLETVGTLKAFYFLHWDDIEFGYRVNQQGFSVRVNSRAIAFHKLYDQPPLPTVRYYDIRNSFYFYLFDSRHIGMKLRVIFYEMIWTILTRPFSRKPLEIYILYKALADLWRGKMGKLDNTTFWSYPVSDADYFILSSYLSLSERIIIANNLSKQAYHFKILVKDAMEEARLGHQFPISQVNHSVINYIKLFFSNLFSQKILISTGYYNKLDILFRRRVYYNDCDLIKKPLSVSIVFDIIFKNTFQSKRKKSC